MNQTTEVHQIARLRIAFDRFSDLINEKVKTGELEDTDRTEAILRFAQHAARRLAIYETLLTALDPIPPELVAWAARHLFELDLTVGFALRSDQATTDFILTAASDQTDVTKSIQEIASRVTSKSLRESALELASHAEQSRAALREGLQEMGYDLVKPEFVKRMAEALGLAWEYDSFYKLACKFTHPSAWCILMPDADAVDKPAYVVAFARGGRNFATRTLVRLVEATGINLDEMEALRKAATTSEPTPDN